MRNSKRVFVLGAGFSYHLSGKLFPLGSDLINIIRELEMPELEKHIQDCIHEPDNIEMILSRFRLDNFISQNRKEAIEEHVFNGFQKQMLVKSIYEKDKEIIENSKLIIKNLFKKDDVIISLNYDLLLDHLLAKSDVDMWSPYGNGYGYSIENDGFIKNDGSNDCNQQKQNIRILKVHGSFNFYTQKYVSKNEYSSIIDILINEKHDSFFDLEAMFENVSDKHFSLYKDARNVKTIVITTYVKPFAQNRTFVKLWHEAIDAIKETDIITIIGYRFPMEDNMMSFLFSYPLIENRKNRMKINILNTSDEISNIKKNIVSVLRGHPDNIEWKGFPLNNKDDAYQNLLICLNN